MVEYVSIRLQGRGHRGDAATGASLVAEFRALGAADARSAPLTRSEAQGQSSVRLLDGVTGVWFAGGDQSWLTAAIGGTPLETAIHRGTTG